MCVSRDFFSTGAVIVQHADSDPPIPSGAVEVEHLGCLVTASEMIAQFLCNDALMEPAYLHAPAPTNVDRSWSFQRFDFDKRRTGPPYVERFRGSERQIDDSTLNE